MPYIQLDGQQYPLAVGENAVGANEGARIRVTGNGSDGVLATFDVAADGSTVVRRLGGIVTVNGVSLGAEPSPLLHGDKIDIAGRELFLATIDARETRSSCTPYVWLRAFRMGRGSRQRQREGA